MNEHQPYLFRRSTRLERDTNKAGLEAYIPTPRGIELVGQLLDSLMSSDYKAFSITGPYGSGKSSFAVFLTALFESSHSEAYHAATKLLKAESSSLFGSLEEMRNLLGVTTTGFVVIRVTSQRAPLLNILREALTAVLGQLSQLDHIQEKARTILEADELEERDIVEVIRLVCLHRPVLLCIDEFGKALEWFSEHKSRQGDLYVLQQLIEQSESRKYKPFALVTLQHLAFDEYAADAAPLRQREWSKIQGRFRDFPFSDSSQTTGFLMTRCLQRLDVPHPIDANLAWDRAKKFQLVENLNLAIEHLAPLHPITAVLLPELCSKYGQHERSLFRFLSSTDERSLQWLVQNDQLVDGWVMPWHLYDYFLASAGSTSALPSLAQRWIEIQTRLRDAVGLTEFELEILKTIGVFNLCSSSGVIRASRDLLSWALSSRAPKTYSLDAAIAQLASTGFMTYREQSDEFRIWRGSDFDLGEQVRLLMASHRHEPLDQLLSTTLTLEPLIATRHSQQRCVVRLFQQCFATTRSDLSSLSPQFNDPDGLLLWWLSDQSADQISLPEWAPAVVIVRMNRPADFSQLVSYVHAYQTLLKSGVIPDQDWVARREAQERLSVSLQKLQDQVLPLLQVSPESEVQLLCPRNKQIKPTGYRSTPTLLSVLCDVVYSETPRIPSEMLSRRELTSQGAKARRILIEALANHPKEDLCGLTRGYGPERSMYDALIGFHRLQQSGYGLCPPSDSSELSPLYRSIDDFFRGAHHTKRPLSDLWTQLKAPPFGLKDGPIPVVLSHYLLLHDDEVGLYEDGRFVASLDTAVIERIAKSPDTFHCSSFALEGLRREYLRRLLNSLGISNASETTLLHAVKQLLRLARQWNNYTRYTQKVSSPTKSIRRALLGAKEPDQLVFIDLPKAVGIDQLNETTLDSAVALIVSSLRELMAAYAALLHDMQSSLAKALNALSSSVRADVAPRAMRLKGQILDPKLKAFALALCDHELDTDSDWIQRVGLSLLGRAPSEWVDADATRFHVALSELAPAFRRLEALHFTQQGDGQDRFKAVRVGVTTSDGEDHQQVITVPYDKVDSLQMFVERMLAEASQSFGDAGAQLVLAEWAHYVMTRSQPTNRPVSLKSSTSQSDEQLHG